jgi:hypothetical protein
VISAATHFEQARHGRLTVSGRIPLDIDTAFEQA